MDREDLRIDVPVSHVFYLGAARGTIYLGVRSNTLYIANVDFTKARTVNEFLLRTGGANMDKTYSYGTGENIYSIEGVFGDLINVGKLYNEYAKLNGLKGKKVFKTLKDLYNFESYLMDKGYINDDLMEF